MIMVWLAEEKTSSHRVKTMTFGESVFTRDAGRKRDAAGWAS